MKKILFLFFSIIAFLFTQNVNAAIYESQLDRYEYKPAWSTRLLDYVPTEVLIPYTNWHTGEKYTLPTATPSSYLFSYPNFYSFQNTGLSNFQSVSPFSVIVNNFDYTPWSSVFKIPFFQQGDIKYFNVFWEKNQESNYCLYIEFWSFKKELKNTCSSKFLDREPFILFVNITSTFFVDYPDYRNFNNVLPSNASQNFETNQNSRIDFSYTLSRTTGCSTTWCTPNISLYKPDTVTLWYDQYKQINNSDQPAFPLSNFGTQILWNDYFIYQDAQSQTHRMRSRGAYTSFAKINSSSAFRSYGYKFSDFPSKNSNYISVNMYNSDWEFPYINVKWNDFLDSFAPAIIETIYWPPVKKPTVQTAPDIDGTGATNASGSTSVWPFKIPKFNMEKPTPPTCEFSLLGGIPCLGEWLNYGFQMVVWILASIIDSVIDFLNFFIDFVANFFSNLIEWFFKVIRDTISNFFPKISFSWYTDTCWNDYTNNNWNALLSSTWTTLELWFMQNIANVISIAIPFAPADQATICTFAWQKTANYQENTKFLDTMFVMFAFSSIIFTLISSKPQND